MYTRKEELVASQRCNHSGLHLHMLEQSHFAREWPLQTHVALFLHQPLSCNQWTNMKRSFSAVKVSMIVGSRSGFHQANNYATPLKSNLGLRPCRQCCLRKIHPCAILQWQCFYAAEDRQPGWPLPQAMAGMLVKAMGLKLAKAC